MIMTVMLIYIAGNAEREQKQKVCPNLSKSQRGQDALSTFVTLKAVTLTSNPPHLLPRIAGKQAGQTRELATQKPCPPTPEQG